VYKAGKIMEEIDAKSFVCIADSWYCKDAENVYLHTTGKFEGADVETFEVFPGTPYAKDKNYVYKDEYIVENANPETFDPNKVTPEG
jgi:hypothetical protein